MTKSTDADRSPPAPERERSVREGNIEAFLDAAERLLISEGAPAITTRRVARAARQNHGLVHYYFGSINELLLQVLERFTERLLERQRGMYAADVPFIEKWRSAMHYLAEDSAAGYPKVWAELESLAWNRPELRERLARVHQEWRAVLREAFSRASVEYGLEVGESDIEAWTALVMAFNLGLQHEQLLGIEEGHAELLSAIDRWLTTLEEGKR